MTGVLIKRGNLDTETAAHRGKVAWRRTLELHCHKPRSAQVHRQLGEARKGPPVRDFRSMPLPPP